MKIKDSQDVHNLVDKSQESSGDSGKHNKNKWGQNSSKMLIPPDNDYSGNNSSINTSGNVAQEMVDFVDNLIDTSPKNRAEKYEKSMFALKVQKT